MGRSALKIRLRKQRALRRNQSRAAAANDMVPVFGFGARLNGEPSCKLDRQTCEEYISLGVAKPVNHGRGIQMCIKWAELRGLSCKIGPKLMWDFIFGQEYAVAAVMSYS